MGLGAGAGQISSQDFLALSLQELEGGSVREIDGWLCSTEIAMVTEKEKKLRPKQQEELTGLLSKFPEVFQEAYGLPPHRNIVHSIVFQEGTTPIIVCPYRYPHHHKSEIERQVEELLKQVIIRHSASPFSSTVILVKKKDDSWRMCVDYRALNKATI